jgi:O-acetylserine/cysteine efflux transporter
MVVPVPLTALSLVVDGPAAMGRGLAHLGWDGVLSTAYTAGLCSLVGYAVFNRLLAKYQSGHVVPWVLLAPVVAMACSWALLGETPGPAELSGAALLVIGVLIAQGVIRPPRPRSRKQPAPVNHPASVEQPAPVGRAILLTDYQSVDRVGEDNTDGRMERDHGRSRERIR